MYSLYTVAMYSCSSVSAITFIMASQPTLELIEHGEYQYVVVDGQMQMTYDTPLLATKFLTFASACWQFAEENGFPTTNAFITTTVHSLVEPTNKVKRSATRPNSLANFRIIQLKGPMLGSVMYL